MSRRMITIERTFNAAIEDVWALWTTADGIESWWGPEGFRVKVRTLDLRPGGALHYDMIAVGPDQIAFMKKAGMPLSQLTRATYKEVKPHARSRSTASSTSCRASSPTRPRASSSSRRAAPTRTSC